MIRLVQTAVFMAAVFLSNPSLAADELSEAAPLAARALLLDVAGNGDDIVAVGMRGHVLFGSESVRQLQVPTRQLLTAVAPAGEIILAGGHDAQILRSRDAGATWNIVYENPEWGAPILDLMWLDENTVVAAGGFGLLLTSVDAGGTWELQDIDLDAPHFYALAPFGDRGLSIIGEFGTLWRADSVTGPWRRLEIPYEGSLFGGLRLDDGRLLTFGLQGNAFIELPGERFAKVDVKTEAALLSAVQMGPVIIAGRAGAVRVLDPQSLAVTVIARDDREDIAALAFDSNGNLLAAGERGLGILSGDSFEFTPIPLLEGADGS